MTRDSRPVLEQVKSGLKIAAIIVVLCAALSVLASCLPIYRMEAWWWHLRHGNTTQVGDFRVAVPSGWFVWSFDAGPTQEIQLANTKGGRAFWATITISQETWQRQGPDLDQLTQLRRKSMESLGIHITDLRQIGLAGANGICVDGETAMAGAPVRNISCRWGTGFAAEYIGSPLNASTFYSILEGASKVPKK